MLLATVLARGWRRLATVLGSERVLDLARRLDRGWRRLATVLGSVRVWDMELWSLLDRGWRWLYRGCTLWATVLGSIRVVKSVRRFGHDSWKVIIVTGMCQSCVGRAVIQYELICGAL